MPVFNDDLSGVPSALGAGIKSAGVTFQFIRILDVLRRALSQEPEMTSLNVVREVGADDIELAYLLPDSPKLAR